MANILGLKPMIILKNDHLVVFLISFAKICINANAPAHVKLTGIIGCL